MDLHVLKWVRVVCTAMVVLSIHTDPQILSSTGRREARRAKVLGRVLEEESKRPLRYAELHLFPSEGGAYAGMATTDGQGRFVFEGVKAGQYRFGVNALGVLPTPGKLMVRSSNGQVSPNSIPSASEDFITLFEDDSLDVEIFARKGGVLRGRITFEDGAPAAAVLVSVWGIGSGGSCQKANIWPGILFVRADDSGSYRVAGLSHGNYVVSATVDFPIFSQNDEGQSKEGRPSLTPTYSGGGVGCSDAVSVLVEEGREAEGVPIVLKYRPTYAVSGTLTALLTDSPIQEAELMIQRDDGDSDLENSTSPNANGHWKFEGLQSGNYTITVLPRRLGFEFDGNPPRGASAERYARKRQAVKIADADINGVAIKLSVGTRIEGRVTTEEGGPLPSPLQVRVVRNQSKNLRAELLDHFARVGSDGRFVMNGVSDGEGEFFIFGLEKSGLYLKSVVWNDRDLKSASLIVSGQPVITGVQIVLARKPSKSD